MLKYLDHRFISEISLIIPQSNTVHAIFVVIMVSPMPRKYAMYYDYDITVMYTMLPFVR